MLLYFWLKMPDSVTLICVIIQGENDCIFWRLLCSGNILRFGVRYRWLCACEELL